jgi:hypothetical protein
MPNYVTLADRYVDQVFTPYSSGIAGASQVEIEFSELEFFLQQLDLCYFSLASANEPLLKHAMQLQVWSMLNLPLNHPIKGVHAVRSRPSSDGTIWRSDPWLWIYPTTTPIPPLPPPLPPPPTFAYARLKLNGVYVAYVHAAVAAIHQ